MEGLYARDWRGMFQVPWKPIKVNSYVAPKTAQTLILEQNTSMVEIQVDGWNAYFSYDWTVSASNFEERIIPDLPRNFSVKSVEVNARWERVVSLIWDASITQALIIQR